ncbi:hypothetical protein HDU91_003904, partial [Kappamyces sp. JEL0680]
PTFYNNRAAAHINNNQFKAALSDCLTCLRLDSSQVKAYFRAAKCQVHLGNLDDALDQINALLAELERVRLAEGGLPSKTVIAHRATANKELAEIKLLTQKIEEYKRAMSGGQHYEALQAIENAMVLVDPSLAGSGLPNCMSSCRSHVAISAVDTARMSKISHKWWVASAHVVGVYIEQKR